LAFFFHCRSLFVEVLRRVVCRAEGRAIEVVELQVHVLFLLRLKVVADVPVSVHFDLNVSICLARKGTGFGEASSLHLLVRLISAGAIPHDSLYLSRR